MSFEGLGKAIRLLRVEQGRSQADLAEEAGVGKSLLSRYETGDVVPTLETVQKLMDALGVGLRQLADALERVQRHLEIAPMRPPGRPPKNSIDLRQLDGGGGVPRAYLVFDLTDELAGADHDAMASTLQRYRSMMRFLHNDFHEPQEGHREVEESAESTGN